MTEENSPAGRTLLRGLALLELVGDHAEGAAVTELSRAAGLDKGTASRLLAALRDAGYIRQRGDKRYQLTGKLLRLARSYLDQLDLREIARDDLSALRDTANETVHLATREGSYVVYIDQFEPDRDIRLRSSIGAKLPLHVAATGRAILAALDEESCDQHLKQLAESHEFDALVVDLPKLSDELQLARDRGWASADRHDDVVRIAAAIVDVTGDPIAAISVSGPVYRAEHRIEHLGEQCVATARRISAKLGSH